MIIHIQPECAAPHGHQFGLGLKVQSLVGSDWFVQFSRSIEALLNKSNDSGTTYLQQRYPIITPSLIKWIFVFFH